MSVAVTDTEAYVLPPQHGAPMYGYDLATGRLLWTVPVPGNEGNDSVAAFDGGFVVSSQNAKYSLVYR